MLGTYGIGSIGHTVDSRDKRLFEASVEGVQKPMENTLEYFWVETGMKVGGLSQSGRMVRRVVCRCHPMGKEGDAPGLA